MSSSRKIVSLQSLLGLRAGARAEGKTVVHCHGCFDIVHPGHIMHLQYARSLGDVLIVSVSADSQVNKGVNRPLIPDDLRAVSLAALECVDCVHVNPHPTAVELLGELRPDVYVKGKEYENNIDPRFLAERQVVEQHGGRVVFSSGEVIYSSTALIDGMAAASGFTDQKVHRFCQKNNLGPAAVNRMLGGFRGRKVAVVGDFILDRYHFCDAVGVAGEGPMMALRHLHRGDYDGGAAVIGLHALGLGANATLVTALAEDEESAQTEMRLAAAGMNVSAIRCRKQLVVKNRFLVDQTKLFKVDEGGAAPADSRTEASLAQAVLAAAQGADAVIFADFGYGVISAGLLERVMGELRKNVPVITADVSGRQGNLLRFREVDLLCPTEREARETLHDFSNGLGFVVWKLLQATAARQAIITLGKQGLVTFNRPDATGADPNGRLGSEYLPALANQAIDPLGCGDALLAAASLALTCGATLQQAAYLGAVAAGVEVRRLGNQPITADDLAAAAVWGGTSQPAAVAA